MMGMRDKGKGIQLPSQGSNRGLWTKSEVCRVRMKADRAAATTRETAGLRPRSFTHEPDDLLGDGAGGFFGHIVPTASKHSTPHIRRD